MVGGAQQTLSGPRILQRLVVLRLRDDRTADDGQLLADENPLATGDNDSEHADLTHVQLQINVQGGQRVVSMPMALLAALRRASVLSDGKREGREATTATREACCGCCRWCRSVESVHQAFGGMWAHVSL